MNENNYGSLPACKKLAEVLAKGIVLETEAYWALYPNTGWQLCLGYRGDNLPSVPAPSMAEAWRELPQVLLIDNYNGYLTLLGSAFKGTYYCGYMSQGERWLKEIIFTGSPTDALIDLWIWVLEQEESHD